MENKVYAEDYIDYVNKMVKNYEHIGSLVNNESGEITPEKINSALGLYYNTSIAIIAEYQRQKINYEMEAIEFKIWEDEKFQQAKAEVIAEYKDTRIKPSVKEFETRMRLINKDEWMKRSMSLSESAARMRFMLRLSDNLQRFDGILTTISYNMRSEMKSLSLDSRMNSNEVIATKNKVRTRFPVSRVKLED